MSKLSWKELLMSELKKSGVDADESDISNDHLLGFEQEAREIMENAHFIDAATEISPETFQEFIHMAEDLVKMDSERRIEKLFKEMTIASPALSFRSLQDARAKRLPSNDPKATEISEEFLLVGRKGPSIH